jgi:hypothetical protein
MMMLTTDASRSVETTTSWSIFMSEAILSGVLGPTSDILDPPSRRNRQMLRASLISNGILFRSQCLSQSRAATEIQAGLDFIDIRWGGGVRECQNKNGSGVVPTG